MRRSLPWRRLAALFVPLSTAVCGGDDTVAPEPIRVQSVVVTPATATASSLGETVSFQAEALDADGNRVSAQMSWVSEGPGVATVDPTSGQATAVTDGTTTLRATAQFSDQGVASSASGTAVLTVAQQASSIQLSANALELVRGTSGNVTASVVDARGNVVAGQSVTWASENESVATVSSDGTITAVAEGQVQVRATAGTLSAAVAVSVVGPPADVVHVSPAADTATVGDTVRFVAVVLAADGDTLDADSLRWSSSETTVASVDSSGLAAALAVGTTTVGVQAWAGGAGVSSSATLVVIEALPDFQPTGDTTVVGDVEVDNLTVPIGVKVTLSGDATVKARGAVSIAGTLEGNCTAFALQADGRVTITGTLTNTCATPPAEGDGADITIVSATGFTLDGADITAGGHVSLRSEGAPSPSPRWVPSPLDRLSPYTADEEEELGCFILNTRVRAADGQSFKDGKTAYGKGLNGLYGADVQAHCGRERLIITGSTLQAGNGGSGENAESQDAETVAEGGHGREAGRILLSSDIAVHFTVLRGMSVLFGGMGGDGGDAVAEGWPIARAVGGAGGPGSKIEVKVPTNGGLIWIEPQGLQIALGGGGKGGEATAEGLPGADATSTEAAKKGGDANATGGAGGDSFPTRPVNLVGDILVGPVQHAANVVFGAGEGGSGGDAFAVGGGGGLGSKEFPDGAGGGDMHAVGGDGGTMVAKNNGAEGWGGGTPGFGGKASFHNGRGGPGFDGCSVNPWVAGGNGGPGGNTSGEDGEGGTSETGEPQSPHGGVLIQDAANGGLGRDGDGPGKGGSGGNDGVTNHGDKEVYSSFEPGGDGEQCSSETAMSTNFSVNSDPGGHDFYVGFRAIAALTLLQIAANQYSLVGAAPWVALLGAVDPLGVLRMSGSGTVAGYSGVQVVLAVTLVRTVLGIITGFSGTVTAGAGGELPGGVPIIYNITGEATGGGSFLLQIRDPATGELVDPASVGLGGLSQEGYDR